MLDCTNIVLVKEKLKDLKVVIDNFNNVHNAYHQNLNDEHCISESNKYSEAVNQLMSDLENEVAHWIVWSKNIPAKTPTPGFCNLPERKAKGSISNVSSPTSTKCSWRSDLRVSCASCNYLSRKIKSCSKTGSIRS